MLNIRVSNAEHYQILSRSSAPLLTNNAHHSVKTRWLSKVFCHNDHELSTAYTTICQTANTANKWILIINPEHNTLAKLAAEKTIDGQKVLKVHVNKVKLDVDKISLALTTGNCAKVVICNPLLTSAQIKKLQRCASMGKTECVILKSEATVH